MATVTASQTKATAGSIPAVSLDTTLYELLNDDCKDGEKIESLCLIKPNSDHSYGHAVPLSDKYIIHSAQVGDGGDLAHLQLENCSHLLMFFAGRMNVIFLGSDGHTNDATLSRGAVDQNAKRSFGTIQESQRPIIHTYANLEDYVRNYAGSKIRWGFAMDFAEKLPYLFHPELIYKLNSKRWLAECNLKSANDHIIDVEISCPNNQLTEASQWYYCDQHCKTCASGIDEEIARVRNMIKQRTLPFVLKLTQSLSSVGTNIVESEADRSELLTKITDYLRNYLPRITAANAHLHTSSLILSDHIPGSTMALNFHVRRDGSVVFLGACHQLATGESGRQATAITYADQDNLEKKYRGVLSKIGQVLNAEGYYGPCGADIMEDPDKQGEEALFTIDLNVRTPLSLVLFLLRGFFEGFGLGMSLVYECIMLSIGRDEMERIFERDFAEGRIVLLGSTRMGRKEQWAYGVVVAGEGKKEIDHVSERILEYESQA